MTKTKKAKLEWYVIVRDWGIVGPFTYEAGREYAANGGPVRGMYFGNRCTNCHKDLLSAESIANAVSPKQAGY